jgi:hypothetical protein
VNALKQQARRLADRCIPETSRDSCETSRDFSECSVFLALDLHLLARLLFLSWMQACIDASMNHSTARLSGSACDRDAHRHDVSSFAALQSAGSAPGDAEQGVTPPAGIPAPSPFAGIPSDAELLESLDPQAMYKEVQRHAATGAHIVCYSASAHWQPQSQ